MDRGLNACTCSLFCFVHIAGALALGHDVLGDLQGRWYSPARSNFVSVFEQRIRAPGSKHLCWKDWLFSARVSW